MVVLFLGSGIVGSGLNLGAVGSIEIKSDLAFYSRQWTK